VRCVIADDNGICRGILFGLVVSDLGWEVVGQAASGDEAIELCRKKRPDIAILDVNMEPTSGDDAAKVILAKGYAGNVILATGAEHMVAAYRALGMKAVPKPYKRQKLAKDVRELLGGTDR